METLAEAKCQCCAPTVSTVFEPAGKVGRTQSVGETIETVDSHPPHPTPR